MAERRVVSPDLPMAMESLEVVQTEFERWWALVAGTPQQRFGFELAVMEIANNIVEHSQRMDVEAGRRFGLELDLVDDTLVAVFGDNGLPAAIDLSVVTMAEEEDEGGRGLALALATLDRLDYHHEDGRNVWRLESRLGSADQVDGPPAGG